MNTIGSNTGEGGFVQFSSSYNKIIEIDGRISYTTLYINHSNYGGQYGTL